MNFKKKFFDPQEGDDLAPAGTIETPVEKAKPVYVYTDEIKLAVNVAFAADRPLLITGPPGSGKSTLARNIAEEKKWRYLREVVTSRIQAADLLGRFDAVQRLNDATGSTKTLLPDAAYLDPGILWWAFNPKDAKTRGQKLEDLDAKTRRLFPTAARREPGAEVAKDAVVLLDEIDKADPDVPNDLLEPLDQGSFTVKPTGHPVTRKHELFIVITSNGERELPPAFMRRCVVLNLEPVDDKWLVKVAKRHFGEKDAELAKLYLPLAERLIKMQTAAADKGLRPPSTAEYLNAIRACGHLGILPGTALWKKVDGVLQAAMWKHEAREKPEAAGN